VRYLAQFRNAPLRVLEVLADERLVPRTEQPTRATGPSSSPDR